MHAVSSEHEIKTGETCILQTFVSLEKKSFFGILCCFFIETCCLLSSSDRTNQLAPISCVRGLEAYIIYMYTKASQFIRHTCYQHVYQRMHRTFKYPKPRSQLELFPANNLSLLYANDCLCPDT